MSAPEVIRSWSSRWPRPNNAVAAAALDSIVFGPADSEIASGVPEDVARAYAAPDGVLPRMRLLAWGWSKPGDRFRAPTDTAWWQERYQYPLWEPLETLADQLERAGVAVEPQIDEDMARGDAGELARSYPSVVQADLPPVDAAPCPRYLIPPTRGMLPIPNPKCLVDKIPVDKLLPRKADNSWMWLALLALVMLGDD